MFEAQMRYIKKHYRVVPLGQMCRELHEERPVAPTLAVTFDDGYRDLYRYAFPVLQKYGIPATIYLIGRCMETGEAPWYDRIFAALKAAPVTTLDVEMETPRSFVLSSPAARAKAACEIVCYLRTIPDARRRKWCAAFESRVAPLESDLSDRMLDWERVRTMHRDGVSFGAHTMTHPAVSRLDAAALENELGLSKRVLENGLDAPVEDFAYPFGKPDDCSPAAEEFLGRSGYRSAATTSEGHNAAGTNPCRLRRLQIGDSTAMSSFAFTVSRMLLEAMPISPAGISSSPSQQALQVRAESGRGAL
ncbi:MAG: polysaccharide deacetylase family protein [Acidobacteriia bacterium]|nr:polysaccharide deacetylase family protein [Terriglobia bacterium]